MPAKSEAQRRYFGYLLGNSKERKKAGVSLAEAARMASKPKGGK
jgi:hypothetical protein